jgi:hypothetical protein
MKTAPFKAGLLVLNSYKLMVVSAAIVVPIIFPMIAVPAIVAIPDNYLVMTAFVP